MCILLDCNVFYTSDSVHRWLVLALFVRNMMMNLHRLVRILKEKSGINLAYKPMHVYIYTNNLVILFQHILCKAFLILKITFFFHFKGWGVELGKAIHFLRSLRCRVEVTEINVRRLDIKACIFFLLWFIFFSLYKLVGFYPPKCLLSNVLPFRLLKTILQRENLKMKWVTGINLHGF